MLPWLLCLVLLIAVLALLVKVHLLQKAMDEIGRELAERLAVDTNTLISLSTRDAHVRKLAAGLNRQLRLLRSDRLRFQNGDRELKEAVTNISHDLRTPLTAIRGYLDLLDREDKSEAVARYLSLIRNRAQAITQLTEELFRYSIVLSTAEHLHPEPLDVRAVLEESLAGFYAAFKERGMIPQIVMPDTPVTRQLDRAALSRIFGNILSNALKYSDGDLTVTLTECGETAFTNTAPRLDEVQVGRLFDRFFTVEAARDSTGLGLSIARALAERMGGTVQARYRDTKLTILVRFPIE